MTSQAWPWCRRQCCWNQCSSIFVGTTPLSFWWAPGPTTVARLRIVCHVLQKLLGENGSGFAKAVLRLGLDTRHDWIWALETMGGSTMNTLLEEYCGTNPVQHDQSIYSYYMLYFDQFRCSELWSRQWLPSFPSNRPVRLLSILSNSRRPVKLLSSLQSPSPPRARDPSDLFCIPFSSHRKDLCICSSNKNDMEKQLCVWKQSKILCAQAIRPWSPENIDLEPKSSFSSLYSSYTWSFLPSMFMVRGL